MKLYIKTLNQKYITIRKIKKTKFGKLFTSKEGINYNKIYSIKVDVLDLNNPSKKIKINGLINTNKKYNIFMNDNIKLNIEKIILDKTLCEYYIN